VLEAGSAAEAKDIWKEHKEDISFVLSDIALGEGQSGPELVEELTRERPELVATLMSGFAPNLTSMPLESGHNFLQKPFDAEGLTNLIAKRFGSRS
jgi:DNA-binding NtrC family response regulator